MKTKNDDISMVPSHIEDSDLVSFLDGEVATDSLTEMQAHLESCWHCRSRLSGIERSIENFLQLRQEVLLPTELPPSVPAHQLFRERLAAHKALSPSDSLFKLKSPDFQDLYRRISNLLNIANHSARTRMLTTRAAAAILLVSMTAGLMFLSDRFNTVSAGELLELSISSQAEQLRGTDQPVVHQKIQVKNKAQNSNEALPVTWEIWNDTVNSRTKFATYEDQSAPNARSARTIGLQNILRINRMNEQRPLSATSYKAWTDGLHSKTEEVADGTILHGLATLIIKTVALEPVAVGGLLEARLTVRAADYHPTELYLRARTHDGEEVFELIEHDFELLSLKNIDPTIFVESVNVETASTNVNASQVSSAETPSGLPEDPHSETAEAEPPIMSGATDAAEIEVLDLLHKAGADITEQLNVTRTATGRLMVEGLVETDNRKREILQVLTPVTNNPAIKIKIQTIKEATLALEKQKQQSRIATIDRIEVQKGTLPVDSELREYFSLKGGDVDSEIRQFASRVINRSQSAAFQASALNRLANRFTLDQLNKLEPAARTKWLNLLKGYALAVRRDTASLRGELQPVFGGLSVDTASESVTNDADLIRSSKRLYDLAAANDRVIRSALTLASGSMSGSAIKTAQFRRSLSSAENLAAAIEKAR